MAYMFKEYEIKTKIVHEQWLQLKMKFLLGYNLKMLFSVCVCVCVWYGD